MPLLWCEIFVGVVAVGPNKKGKNISLIFTLIQLTLLLFLDPKDSGDSGLIGCSTTLTNLGSIEKKKKENPEGDEEDDSEREVEMERSQG